MRSTLVLALAAFGSAFVVPSEEVLADISIEDTHRDTWYQDAVSAKDDVVSGFKKHFDDLTDTSRKTWDDVIDTSRKTWDDVVDTSRNAFDDAISRIDEASDAVSDRVYESAFDAQAWLESEVSALDPSVDGHHSPPDHDHPPHHGPPHHGPPHHGPPHHHKPNETIYQIIAKSKYTTKLAKLLSEYPDLVNALNSTDANFTVFAPTDKAFAKIPDHAPKPSKEQLQAILSYHVVAGCYPAGRVLRTHTAPTLLVSDHLGPKTRPQRVSFHLGLRGLTINFVSRIIPVNVPATNGFIHGLDSILIPPPNAVKIIDLLPGEFSTLELGLAKTGLLDELNSTHHTGGTLFAPSNRAFLKLGPKINAFLFSKFGLKYLKALLQYHTVPGNTLYSDAFYKADDTKGEGVPKGYYHLDLPTLLEDRSLSVDVSRWGAFISIKVNAFARVVVQDGIAEDGVIQVVSDVLVPPKKLGGQHEFVDWDGEEMDLDDFIDRLEPFVAKSDL